MRCGTKENVKLDGKLHEILVYEVNTLSAYKLSGFFIELLDKAKAMNKPVIIRADQGEIINIDKYDVYFMPENGWDNAAKQRDDYYGKFTLSVFDENGQEKDAIAYDDCYNKEENINVIKIDHVKTIISDSVVIEIKTK